MILACCVESPVATAEPGLLYQRPGEALPAVLATLVPGWPEFLVSQAVTFFYRSWRQQQKPQPLAGRWQAYSFGKQIIH